MKSIGLIIVLIFIFFNQNTYVDLKNYQSEKITVEVKGEVKKPGVYKIAYNAKVKDVIQKSGGLSEMADDRDLNYAKALKNEDVIVVNKRQEATKVSLNAGSIEELSTLPGIGPATAQRIIDYRMNIGSFQAIEDVQKVKGIKSKLFEKIKDYITL